MNPDALKQYWQAESPKVTLDVELLLAELRQNEKAFRATIFWRDLREVGIALLMVPTWFYLGAKASLPWTWFLMVPALLWIAVFMLADRWRHQQASVADESLSEHVRALLAQVEHQAWLLRNVFWWYLLPPGLALVAFFTQVAWKNLAFGWPSIATIAGVVAVEALVFAFIYWLNRSAVRSHLDPRSQELRRLLASFHEGSSDVVSHPLSSSPRPLAPKRVLLLGALISSALLLGVWAYTFGGPKALRYSGEFSPRAGDPEITRVLTPIQEKYRLPAIAAAVVTSRGLVSAGVVGTRKQGSEVPATLQDLWHLGSDGKAMTATLTAKLVEQGKLRWESSVGEIFPELAAGMDSQARTITVLHLLSHRSGLPANPDLIAYGGRDGRQERLRLVKEILSKPLPHRPGEHYEYSNLGYSIMGAVIERITSKTWEDAMREQVFAPLGMTSVGFGGTGTPGRLDQPWGHDSTGHPVAGNGPDMDNPPVLSPAGRVHCTIQDWARFIADQLRGARGEKALLQPSSYHMLHTPPFGGEYALGWLVVERTWGGGKVLNHGGDNTMNCANVWVAPVKDFAILVCINQSGNTAFQASDDAVGALIRLHSTKTQTTAETVR